jgi:L-alanine-DL-glutamate epimerase-like enolase superfamily enzyme
MKFHTEFLTLKQRETFKTHDAVIEESRQVVVEVEWSGKVGIGTIIIGSNYGVKETELPEVLATCRAISVRRSPFEYEKILSDLWSKLRRYPAAICGLDVAVADLRAQLEAKPLYEYIGSKRFGGQTGLSIGIGTQEELLERVVEKKDWPILKLKVGTEFDPMLLADVRNIYEGRIWIDCNGCWNGKRAREVAVKLADFNVEILEQPTAKGDFEGLSCVGRDLPVSIIADQDSVTADDCERLAGLVDGITVKIHRCGGITAAHHMMHQAKRFDLKIMLGCITENVINITASSHLAAEADFVDLDGNLDLVDDPFSGVIVEQGLLRMPTSFGAGVTRR